MKNWLPYMFILIMLLGACNSGEQTGNLGENSGEDAAEDNIDYKLLHQLNYMPPEIGSSISIVQDEKLYLTWAEIFEFDTVHAIDFETEEVLFITAYSDGCGRVFESVKKEGETLIVKLNYPEDIRKEKDIVCTEIALPNTYVIKMEKTNTTKGKLIDIQRTIYEDNAIVQEKLQ
ncbi:dehydrogenase [Solibacillus merdavium]|uniref:Dehydrogenase n=1 Tax=Solibacillus merdavium TaxID=2762218 RepID=A0ABR8XSN5_9BACL|nr:dehydrogenase [Solibacillus merdavium]MBD8034942.1 dehydrogenase [Solibacillus merdavium]